MTSARILIVDDEPFNVDYLEQELEEAGYQTLSAGDGQQALEKVKSETPDLVLLDIMMPLMDGFEVLSRLKSDQATRDIPVIVISASSSLESVVKGIQLGAEDYLPKPFEPVLLQARISSGLEKKRLRDLQKLYLKGLERELDIAREIQLGFLPAELPTLPGWEIGAYFKAAREVAGDFYDAFTLPDGNLVCLVGDVCGKGVGAALFMTLFRSLLRAACTTENFFGRGDGKQLTHEQLLLQAISFTNDYVASTHGDASMFATIFIGILDLLEGTLTYINAGNEPPILAARTGGLTYLKPTGPVVGIIPGANFQIGCASMQAEDLLLAFTDGIPDALSSEEESFGHERLLPLLENRQGTAAALLKQIEDELHEFIGTAAQFDDITLMAVRRG
jgi:serine phosphatase RsbU (regulator of sigma subunit)